jgi:hypothetical protein
MDDNKFIPIHSAQNVVEWTLKEEGRRRACHIDQFLKEISALKSKK